jgi:hypothetical protein
MIEAKDLIDISVTWCPGETLIYPGDPAPEYGMIWELDKGGIANVGYLRTGNHYATHVDAPWHFTNSGKKMHEVSLDHWIGPAAVLDCTDEPVCVSSDTLRRFDLTGVERVLFKTMNSVDYYLREGFYEKLLLSGQERRCEYLVRETRQNGGDRLHHRRSLYVRRISRPPHIAGKWGADHECIDLRDVEPRRISTAVFPAEAEDTDGGAGKGVLDQALEPLRDGGTRRTSMPRFIQAKPYGGRQGKGNELLGGI